MNERTPAAQSSNVVIRASRYTYAETIARLTAAIVKGGSTVFATIDQRAAAQGAGLELRPTTLIIFGNPKGGTPLMEACPQFALELPLKLAVWEDAGDTHVAYAPLAERALRYNVSAKAAQLTALDAALETLAKSIA